MTKTVLVVDDEPANIDLVKGLMPDFKVKAALKGEIALKLINKQPPDVVLLDLVMPGLSGFETLEQLRATEVGEQLPVIIVSGNASEQDIAKGKTLGVIGYLQKPINSEQLFSLIDSI